MKFSKTDYFLIKCARRDPYALSKSGTNELNKTRIEGSLVILTVLLGFFSSAYGTFVVYQNFLGSLFFGAVLGTLVYILDGAILSYTRSAPWYITLVRFILTSATSLLFSSLVSVGFFADKIIEIHTEQIVVSENSVKEKFNSQIFQLQDELAKRKSLVDRKEKIFLDEVSGTSAMGSTGVVGYGEIAKIKENALTKEQEIFTNYKKDIFKKIKALEIKMDQEIKLKKASQARGILGSLIALFTGGDDWLHFWMLVFHIIFMGFDLSTILIKLSPSRGFDLYYKVIDLQEHAIYKAAKQSVNFEIELEKLNYELNFNKKKVQIENDNSSNLIEIQNAHIDALIKQLLSTADLEYQTIKRIDSKNLTTIERQKYIDSIQTLFSVKVKNITESSNRHNSDSIIT